MSEIRRFENLHILLWLLKDSAWLMQWRWMGVGMIVPTVWVALQIAIWAYRKGDIEFWVQLAVCMWITANSYWMCCEFFDFESMRHLAAIPFALGFLCVSIYYIKRGQGKAEA